MRMQKIKKWFNIIVVSIMAFMLIASYSFFLIPGFDQNPAPVQNTEIPETVAPIVDFKGPTGPPPSAENPTGFVGPTTPPSATQPTQGPLR